MELTLKKAVREQLKLRVALIGPAGSGKTYSALTLCKGLGGKTLLIDTEEKRGLHYANEFDYYYEKFDPPHTPERYIEWITAAEKVGVDNLILDSASHEWFTLLREKEIYDSKSKSGNTYISWAKFTPRHDAFIAKVNSSQLNIIVNMRGKDEYVLQETNGRQVPKKVGMGPQMRDGFEYECTVAFILDLDGNTAVTSKDNTHKFENIMRRLTVEDGIALAKWANSGETPTVQPKSPTIPIATYDDTPMVVTPPHLKYGDICKALKNVRDLGTNNEDKFEALKLCLLELNPHIKKLSQDEYAAIGALKDMLKAEFSKKPDPPDTPFGCDPPEEKNAETKSIFDSEGEIKGESPVEQAIENPHYSSLLRLVQITKIKGALEGIIGAASDLLDDGKITAIEYNNVKAMIETRRVELTKKRGV